MTRDARGIVMEVAAEQSRPPQHGQSVISTLDLMTQIRTEEHLDQLMEEWKPLGACAIVMEPRSGEILAMMLLTWNNLAYYQDLMAGARKAIAEGRYADYVAECREGWARGESA